MFNSEIQKRIDAQESKDRYVAERCLKDNILKCCGNNLSISATPTTCYVDLKCNVGITYFNVEIKERFKKGIFLKENPVAELKVSKLKRMRSATPEDTRLFYMVLLNQRTCYLFDLDNLDWENVECRLWHIKKTQLDDDSEYVDELTYFIPYSMAVRKCDCSKYFSEYGLKIMNQ